MAARLSVDLRLLWEVPPFLWTKGSGALPVDSHGHLPAPSRAMATPKGRGTGAWSRVGGVPEMTPQETGLGVAPSEPELHRARERLAGQVRRTPILELEGAELGLDTRVGCKLEVLQHTGSFKARGALNAVLAATEVAEEPRGRTAGGVVAASGGNHGAAVAWAARRSGVSARIFVPDGTPEAKLDRIRSYGAEVEIVQGQYPDALAVCREWSQGKDVREIHAYDAPDVVAGQATLGTEIAEQVPDVSVVLVSCGGGGLFAGTALGLRDRAGVLPVEPASCPSLHAAARRGEPVPVEVGGAAVDSMGASVAGRIATGVARERGVMPLLVPDQEILAARRWLWERCRILAEPGGVTALAALTSGLFTPAADARTVVVISGGNHADVPS